ncbi:MAG: ABC-2 family transporter protein [Anaerolineae bacterium]|nr:ABC-2 family transporter protein [Anaerolineae bacterium]
MKAGIALMKAVWASWLQYRSFFFVLAFGWMIPPLIYLFVWSTAAGEQGIGDFSRDTFIVYYLALILVNQLTYSQTNWTVGDIIRSGGLNTLLLRPMPPIYDTLASEMAGKVVYMIFVIPVTAALALFLRPEVHIESQHLLAFLPALLLAWLLRFFWGYWLALLAFWATRADALLAAQDSLVFLLAGQVAPTPLLPGFIGQAAVYLPFRYMIGFPIEILTGQLTSAEIGAGFFIQGCWLAAALLLSRFMWRFGIRHYAAVGG